MGGEVVILGNSLISNLLQSLHHSAVDTYIHHIRDIMKLCWVVVSPGWAARGSRACSRYFTFLLLCSTQVHTTSTQVLCTQAALSLFEAILKIHCHLRRILHFTLHLWSVCFTLGWRVLFFLHMPPSFTLLSILNAFPFTTLLLPTTTTTSSLEPIAIKRAEGVMDRSPICSLDQRLMRRPLNQFTSSRALPNYPQIPSGFDSQGWLG